MAVAVTAIWSPATKLSNMLSPTPELFCFGPKRQGSPLSLPLMALIVYVFACHPNITARMSDCHEAPSHLTTAGWLN